MAKCLILYLKEAHHLLPTTASTSTRWIRDSSRSQKSRISSKEVLNFQYPVRLGLLASHKLTLTSLGSVFPTQLNVGQETNMVTQMEPVG